MKTLTAFTLCLLISGAAVAQTGQATETRLKFKHGRALVSSGGLYGYVNEAGTEITPIKYQSIEKFNEGYELVKAGGLYGLIIATGTEVVPCSYGSIERYHRGRAKAYRQGKWYYLDLVGKETPAEKPKRVSKLAVM